MPQSAALALTSFLALPCSLGFFALPYSAATPVVVPVSAVAAGKDFVGTVVPFLVPVGLLICCFVCLPVPLFLGIPPPQSEPVLLPVAPGYRFFGRRLKVSAGSSSASSSVVS